MNLLSGINQKPITAAFYEPSLDSIRPKKEEVVIGTRL